ncbi:MAG: hypothetical protein JXJ19_00665 [Elusimicrobia bacterium]|nr:hypothetical protein [Elusimicrobiota bacterium]
MSADICPVSGAVWDEDVYTEKEYTDIFGMYGFDRYTAENHYEKYRLYVQKGNELYRKLDEMRSSSSMGTAEYAKLRDEFNRTVRDIKLHEYYFQNLGGAGRLDWDSPVYKSIEKNYGTFDCWKADFINTGMDKGNGWVILCQYNDTKQLVNVWVDENGAGFPVDARFIVVMDMYDHAYKAGTDRKKYIEAFINNIKWDTVSKRLK